MYPTFVYNINVYNIFYLCQIHISTNRTNKNNMNLWYLRDHRIKKYINNCVNNYVIFVYIRMFNFVCACYLICFDRFIHIINYFKNKTIFVHFISVLFRIFMVLNHLYQTFSQFFLTSYIFNPNKKQIILYNSQEFRKP